MGAHTSYYIGLSTQSVGELDPDWIKIPATIPVSRRYFTPLRKWMGTKEKAKNPNPK